MKKDEMKKDEAKPAKKHKKEKKAKKAEGKSDAMAPAAK
jgi:hypothetical protein